MIRHHDRAVSTEQVKWHSGDLSILVFIVDRRKLDVRDGISTAQHKWSKKHAFNSIWFSEAVKKAAVEYSSNKTPRRGANTHTQIRIEVVTDLITKAKQIEYLINSLPKPEPEEEQVGFRLMMYC